MILSKRVFRWVHSVALFAIVFASLAPSISHAIAVKQGTSSFAQEICSTDGLTIIIEVVTSKGNQLATELDAEVGDSQAPVDISHHLNHCPFCANPGTSLALEPSHAFILDLLEAQAQQLTAFSQVNLPHFSALPPPAQAPPIFI